VNTLYATSSSKKEKKRQGEKATVSVNSEQERDHRERRRGNGLPTPQIYYSSNRRKHLSRTGLLKNTGRREVSLGGRDVSCGTSGDLAAGRKEKKSGLRLSLSLFKSLRISKKTYQAGNGKRKIRKKKVARRSLWFNPLQKKICDQLRERNLIAERKKKKQSVRIAGYSLYSSCSENGQVFGHLNIIYNLKGKEGKEGQPLAVTKRKGGRSTSTLTI